MESAPGRLSLIDYTLNHRRERFTLLTTGTSISTPTTEASAAPDWKPKGR